ncbi:MAG: Gfo/Idh/MocA family oxidoreductase [Elainella sp. Prado103]|nr:Gfo/Idh/MocA family oxidoreductase [Elainella sp. Prado103]
MPVTKSLTNVTANAATNSATNAATHVVTHVVTHVATHTVMDPLTGESPTVQLAGESPRRPSIKLDRSVRGNAASLMVSPAPNFSGSRLITPERPVGQPFQALQYTSERSESVKVALFGLGRWGSHWLRKFADHPQAELVAVVDPCVDRLELAQQGLTDRAIATYTDWRKALEIPGLAAVAIITPASTHYEMIQTALQHNLHVLAEKPLTLETAKAIELCQLADQQQRQLVIDHTYLFNAAVQRGRCLVQQGQLGQLRYGYASRTHLGPVRHDVDALWDLAIHDIAIFNHWLNDVPVRVQAQGHQWLHLEPWETLKQSDLSHPSSPGLADLVWIKLTYASGFEAIVQLCWANPDKQRRLSLVGSEGSLVFDELAAFPLTLWQGQLCRQAGQFVPQNQQQQVIELEPIEPLQAVCDHFLSCVRHNQPSEISSGWLGAELVTILAALSQSLQAGGVPIAISH